MIVFYADHHVVDLPPGHRFPMAKYAALRHRLMDEGVLRADELHASGAIERRALLRVHTPDYVDAFLDGRLNRAEQRNLGLPWSRALVGRTLASAFGTLAAARAALSFGAAGNLAGGTHHAFAGHGEGFCVFNDLAVAARTLLDEGAVGRVLVVDLDVHHGNGTAAIFADEPRVWCLDVHGANNYPFTKPPADLDVPLPDGTTDAPYLQALRPALETALEQSQPDLIFYQAGVDPLASDKLGRLSLSFAGLQARDRMVLELAHHHQIPIALTLGGGYARPITDSIQAHVQTYKLLKTLY